MWYRHVQAAAYLNTRQYEKAIEACKKALLLNPDFLWVQVELVMCYSLAGQEEKAHAQAKEVLRIRPKFSVDLYVKNVYLPAKQRDRQDIYINALRKAGLK